MAIIENFINYLNYINQSISLKMNVSDSSDEEQILEVWFALDVYIVLVHICLVFIIKFSYLKIGHI